MDLNLISEVSFKDNGEMVVMYNNELEHCREVFKMINGKWVHVESYKKLH